MVQKTLNKANGRTVEECKKRPSSKRSTETPPKMTVLVTVGKNEERADTLSEDDDKSDAGGISPSVILDNYPHYKLHGW